MVLLYTDVHVLPSNSVVKKWGMPPTTPYAIIQATVILALLTVLNEAAL